MDIERIKAATNDYDKINEIYNGYDEENRLTPISQRIEFLTTVRYIEKYLKPGMRILDLGAGTGVYSFYFAEQGYEVVAVEITKKHVDIMNHKKTDELPLTIIHGNAVEELQNFEDGSFDIVLCFGPLYHIGKEEERVLCLNEVQRVCKDGGYTYIAFINNDFIIATETLCYDLNYIQGEDYDSVTYKVNDFPFIFYKLQDARDLLEQCKYQISHEVASDGFSELMQSRINSMDEATYKRWIDYHFYTCERKEFLGSTNHFLFVSIK